MPVIIFLVALILIIILAVVLIAATLGIGALYLVGKFAFELFILYVGWRIVVSLWNNFKKGGSKD